MREGGELYEEDLEEARGARESAVLLLLMESTEKLQRKEHAILAKQSLPHGPLFGQYWHGSEF